MADHVTDCVPLVCIGDLECPSKQCCRNVDHPTYSGKVFMDSRSMKGYVGFTVQLQISSLGVTL